MVVIIFIYVICINTYYCIVASCHSSREGTSSQYGTNSTRYQVAWRESMPDKPKMQLPKFVGLVSAPLNFRWTRSLSLGGAVAFPLLVFWWKPEKIIRSTIISPWHHVYWGSMSDGSSAQMRSVSSVTALSNAYTGPSSPSSVLSPKGSESFCWGHQSQFEHNDVHAYV